MREIVFRNLISQDKRHADISVTEVFENNDVVTTAEKSCIYVIKKQELPGPSLNCETPYLTEEFSKNNCPKRQFFITRFRDEKKHSECLFLKVLGDFYVVFANQIFFVSFKYTMRIRQERKLKLKV